MTPNFPQDFEKCVYSPENIKTLFPVLFHFRLVPITTRFLHVDFTSTTTRYTRNIHTYPHALSKLNRSIIRKIFCQNFDHPLCKRSSLSQIRWKRVKNCVESSDFPAVFPPIICDFFMFWFLVCRLSQRGVCDIFWAK